MRGVTLSGVSRSPLTRALPAVRGPAAAVLPLVAAPRASGRPGHGTTAVGTAGWWGRWGLDGMRKTLRLPRCLRRGGMRAFGRGLNVPCQRQVVGVQWWYGPPTYTPCRLRYAIPLGLVAQVPTRCVAR